MVLAERKFRVVLFEQSGTGRPAHEGEKPPKKKNCWLKEGDRPTKILGVEVRLNTKADISR